MYRMMCDFLIVAIADDTFARKKGEGRPIVGEADRLFSVQSLRCVDHAFICNGSVDAVNRINPDLYFREDIYTNDPDLDPKIKVVRFPMFGTSTTGIVNKIKRV